MKPAQHQICSGKNACAAVAFPQLHRSPLASSIRVKDFPNRFVYNDRSPIHRVLV